MTDKIKDSTDISNWGKDSEGSSPRIFRYMNDLPMLRRKHVWFIRNFTEKVSSDLQ